MSTQSLTDELFNPALIGDTQPLRTVRRAPKPRIRGLSMPALPSWPLVAQVTGGIATLSGVYLEWGSAITLITGGVAAVVLGALRESGRI
jgi:hypothetical protein